jgi:aldehyde:ferredoxin oxidoreductase
MLLYVQKFIIQYNFRSLGETMQSVSLELAAWVIYERAISVVKQQGFEPFSPPPADKAVAMTHRIWISKKTLQRLGANAQHRLSQRVSELISEYYYGSTYPPFATMRPTSRVIEIYADRLSEVKA